MDRPNRHEIATAAIVAFCLAAVVLSVRWSAAVPNDPALPTVEMPPNACEAAGGYVVDGDTIMAHFVNLPFDVCLRDQRVRAQSYDAYESNRLRFSDTTDVEIAKGKKATAYLESLKAKGTLFVVSRGRPRDGWGRLVADFYVRTDDGKTINVASAMKDGGHVRP